MRIKRLVSIECSVRILSYFEGNKLYGMLPTVDFYAPKRYQIVFIVS